MTADEAVVRFGGRVHRSKSWQSWEKVPVNKEPVSYSLMTRILYDSTNLAWVGFFLKVRKKKKVCRSSCLCVCELPVSVLTFAGAFVRLQLHEVRAGTREGLVEVDETEVGARASTITGGTWVRSWKKKTHTKRQYHKSITIKSYFNGPLHQWNFKESECLYQPCQHSLFSHHCHGHWLQLSVNNSVRDLFSCLQLQDPVHFSCPHTTGINTAIDY